MNREIKFRAWDKNQKRMVPDKELQMQSMPDFKAVPINQSLMMLGLVYDLMQYAGLKDEAGKEIYESDIIEYVYYHPVTGKQVYRNIVVFNEGRGCWCAEYLDGEYHYFGEMIFKSACRVIGNIYENSDLLSRG